MGKKVVDKNLIPTLLAGTVVQTTEQPTNDLKMLADYNLGFVILIIAAEDVKDPSDKIDMGWCIQTLYELSNGQNMPF